jgi:hypothetical protein
MSGTLLTGEKKIRDTIAHAALREGPTRLGPIELATVVDRRGTSAENA